MEQSRNVKKETRNLMIFLMSTPSHNSTEGDALETLSGQTAISFLLAATEKTESVLGMSRNHISEFIAGNVQQ